MLISSRRAFTNLIADQQFAAMGLVLLANLARIRRLVSRMAPREPGQRQVRAVPEVRVVVEDDEDLGEFVTRSARGNEALSMPLGLEHGPAVAKTSEPGKEGAENSSPAEARSPIVSSPALASKPTKKERRKRSGAIDELFDTII